MNPVKEVAIVPVEKSDVVAQIVGMAADPNMDVGKLEKLMQMQRELATIQAKLTFNAAMTKAQMSMRPIAADASNPQTRSKYASYAALDNKLRPIYTDNGFGLSFNTADGAKDGWIRVVCNVCHSGGFDKDYHVDMPADGKGAKGGDVMTLTHAVGAGLSYGMRYLLKMIFNVAVGEDDRDGNDPQTPPATEPAGFQDWLDDFITTADDGVQAIEAAWKASDIKFREYAQKHRKDTLFMAKAKAKKVELELSRFKSGLGNV